MESSTSQRRTLSGMRWVGGPFYLSPLRAAGLVAAICGILVAAVASAAGEHANAEPVVIRVTDRGMHLDGTARDDFLLVRPGGGGVMIRNPFGELAIDPDGSGDGLCHHASERNVVCSLRRPRIFRARLGGGDDYLTIRITIQHKFIAYGGPGDDGVAPEVAADYPALIIGGSGRDQLAGGYAKDRLIGGTGSDGLLGDRGADELLGGAGNDSLNAKDAERDRKITCGSGDRDEALIDRTRDPRTDGCEFPTDLP